MKTSLYCTISQINILKIGLQMAKTNYGYEKYSRELEKQKKKEEKMKKKLAKKSDETTQVDRSSTEEK